MPAHHKTHALLPGPNLGIITPEYLEAVAAVVKKHNIPLLRLTSSQRLAIGGFDPDKKTEILREIALPQPPAGSTGGVQCIHPCPGAAWCRHGHQDTLALGAQLAQALTGLDTPGGVKIGISGCVRNCGQSYVRDVGFFGTPKGWTVIFGGNAGARPRIGDVIARNLPATRAVELARACLTYYAAKARPRERTARFMERCAPDCFKKAVLSSIEQNSG